MCRVSRKFRQSVIVKEIHLIRKRQGGMGRIYGENQTAAYSGRTILTLDIVLGFIHPQYVVPLLHHFYLF